MDQKDEPTPWDEKYRDLEQKTFDDWFDEALKPDEIKGLKEENKLLKETIEENKKSTLPAHENAFIHQGDAWEIWFKGIKLKPIKEMDGMIYIANLLKNPGRWIHVTDLCASASRRRDEAMMTENDMTASLKDGNMSISTMQDDGLDNQSKEELWDKIDQLNGTIANSTLSENVRAKAENDKEALIKLADNLYGKKSIHHRAPKKVNESVKDDLDRARRAIERTREKIHEQSPELAEYLHSTINRGTEYCFNDKITHWHISE